LDFTEKYLEQDISILDIALFSGATDDDGG